MDGARARRLAAHLVALDQREDVVGRLAQHAQQARAARLAELGAHVLRRQPQAGVDQPRIAPRAAMPDPLRLQHDGVLAGLGRVQRGREPGEAAADHRELGARLAVEPGAAGGLGLLRRAVPEGDGGVGHGRARSCGRRGGGRRHAARSERHTRRRRTARASTWGAVAGFLCGMRPRAVSATPAGPREGGRRRTGRLPRRGAGVLGRAARAARPPPGAAPRRVVRIGWRRAEPGPNAPPSPWPSLLAPQGEAAARPSGRPAREATRSPWREAGPRAVAEGARLRRTGGAQARRRSLEEIPSRGIW